ncbi:MAG: hypothetical protein Q7S00_06245 [bacterium]|nr:hypothetical protein [bacterium]
MVEVYNQQCFAYSPCPEGISFAGIYDYVGAVYGEAGKGAFDGQLTDVERTYVEETFGRLTDMSELPAYMERARKYLFDHVTEYRVMPDVGLCLREKFLVTEGRSLQYGEAVVLGGTHSCGALYGQLYFPYEFMIAQAADQWTFFVENAHPNPKNKQPLEKILFFRIADRLHIPVREPVIQMDDAKVLKEMETRHRIGKLELVSYVAVLAISKAQEGMIAEKGEAIVNDQREMGAMYWRQIDRFSDQFKISGETLDRGVRFLLEQPFSQVKRTADQYVVWYGEIADELSPQLVREGLQTANGSYSFYQLGSGHLPVLEAVYTLKPVRKPFVEE